MRLAEPLEIGGVPAHLGHPVPAIVVSGNNVGVIWSDVPISEEPLRETYVYYRSSSDLGDHWGSVKKLETASKQPVIIRAKDISSYGNEVHVITSSGYFRSVDSGATWSTITAGRVGSAIASDRGWTSIVEEDHGAIFHAGFSGIGLVDKACH
jgi:hypothetical protein